MDWTKVGVFKHLNRVDVWQHIFEFLDVKTVVNGLAKSCRCLKVLCLMHISHIKSICILSLSIDGKSSYNNLIELLKCEKTFLLKLTSNAKTNDFMNTNYKNKSIVRLKYKSSNNNFLSLIPLIRSISNFSYFTFSGSSALPAVSQEIIEEMIKVLKEKKIGFLKISKVTLTGEVLKAIKKYIKEKTPMVLIIDVACFSDKATSFQNYLTELWKKKWLLTIDYKVNGKMMFNCTRDFA